MSYMKEYLFDRYGEPDNWPEKEGEMHCKYPTKRTNFVIVYTPNCDLAFSYETLVGVQGFLSPSGDPTASRFRQWLVSKNTWGPTTGKHLNELDNGRKESRVDQSEVEAVAIEMLTGQEKAILTDLHTAHDAAIEAFK